MKKILVLLILFLPLDFAFGQITCVDSETIFSKLGVEISYCTISLGKDGACSKYKVTIYEKNSSDQTISIEGAQLFIDPQIGMFPAAGACGKREEYAGPDGIIWIEFPWNANGLKTEIPPNSSFQKSFIVYTNGKYPKVGYRGVIYARSLNDKSSSKNNGSSNNTGTNNQTTKSSNTNQTSNSQGSSGSSSGGGDVNAKIDAINVHLNKIPDNDSEAQAIMRDAASITTNSNTSDAQKANQLTPLISRARNRANAIATNKSEEDTRARKAQEVAQEKAKAAQQQMDNFIKYYDKGVSDLNAKNYDGAISNIQTALNYAADDSQRSLAQNLLNKAQEEKRLEAEAAARKVRVEERQKQEAATNAATGAALSAVGALMALMNDSYTQKPFAARYYLGFGMENLILNINDFTNKQSDIKSSLPLVFMGGLNFTLFNNKNVNWVINPYFRYNQIFVSTGEAGSGYGAGINTHLSFGFRKDSPIRFFGEYQYNINTLETSYDTDVASGGTTATDAVYEGYYETLSKRIGGGLILRFINGDRETFIKPGYFIDNIALLGIKRNYASLDMYFANTIGIELAYSKNYVSLGDVDFPNSSKMKSAIKDPIATDYWTVKFYRRGLFGKK